MKQRGNCWQGVLEGGYVEIFWSIIVHFLPVALANESCSGSARRRLQIQANYLQNMHELSVQNGRKYMP